MKKKIIPYISFILILSFLLPFFPSFSISAIAEDSVSSDDAFIKWEKDNVDAIRNGLAGKGTVVNPEFYLVTDDTINPNLWEIIARNYNIDYQVNVGKPLSRQIYDYTVSNHITSGDIYNDCFNNIYNEISVYCPYVIYSTYHKSDLIDTFSPSNSRTALWFNKFDVSVLDSNCFYFFQTASTYYRLDTADWGAHYLDVIEFPLDYLDTYYFYSKGNAASSLFEDPNFFHSLVYNPGGMTTFNIWSTSANGYNSTQTLNGYKFYAFGDGFTNYESKTYTSKFGYAPLYYYYDNPTYDLNGSFFLVPDSVERISFPFFRSYNSVFNFINGNSFVYEFDPDIDITKYGNDLDLTDLYDVISDTVGDAEGNIIDSINGVANNYLRDQVRLLGDIKNALNDSFGNSWLRLIHGQLADYFPKTLDSLDDLVEAISNLSFSGGGGSVDLSSTNTILSDIYDRLGLMLGPYNGDGFTQNTLNHITNELAGKMPFCVVTDVVVIGALFSHEPVHPDFQFPVPFQPGETFEIDISFWEYARPFINAFFIILFIIGLLVLTQKIFNSLKG